MNILLESIPTVFKPETAFAIALHDANEQLARANDKPYLSRSQLLREEFEWSGVPESPLHD